MAQKVERFFTEPPCRGKKHRRFIIVFPSLCPEPVLANIRLSAQNGSKNAGVFRTSSLPNTEQAIWVAKVEPEYPEKHILFLSAFPMFVPSLSWQNNAF